MAQIGVDKLVEAVSGTAAGFLKFQPPSGKEWLINFAFFKHNHATAANSSWQIGYNSVSQQEVDFSLAQNVWRSLATSFPGLFDREPLRITNQMYLQANSASLGEITIHAYVIERPLNFDLQSLEWQYEPGDNKMPPGLQDLINLQLGYRTREQRL